VQRLTAGPAVPLIYEFFKLKIPATQMKRCLESSPKPKHPDFITSHDIVLAAMNKTDPDPLCLKVVEKFTELLAVEIGDLALKTLPYGGIYLVGGVTEGIKDHLLGSGNFHRHFCAK
jgi:glucokinase